MPPDALIALAPATVGGAQVPTVNARELHAFLGVGRDFTTWVAERVAAFGFVEGADYVTDLLPNFGEKGQGRPTREFHLTLDMAKELSMVERTPKGREARRYFIECERQAKAGQPAAFLNDPVALRRLLLEGTEREIALRADVQELAPKADALDRLATADGSLCRTDAAKLLQVPRKVLLDHMRTKRWTYTRTDTSDEVGYQDKIEAGLIEHKTRIIPTRSHGDKVRVQVRITPKGLARLGRELAP